MAITTLQVTQTGSTIQVSATSIKCRWVTFANTAGAAMRVGDANTTATRGVSLPLTTGIYSPPVPATSDTFGTDLSQWYTVGTNTQLLDVIYDSMNF